MHFVMTLVGVAAAAAPPSPVLPPFCTLLLIPLFFLSFRVFHFHNWYFSGFTRNVFAVYPSIKAKPAYVTPPSK